MMNLQELMCNEFLQSIPFRAALHNDEIMLAVILQKDHELFNIVNMTAYICSKCFTKQLSLYEIQ